MSTEPQGCTCEPHPFLPSWIKKCDYCKALESTVARQAEEIYRLKSILSESNEACVCGCPSDAHESYGEDGEGCGNDSHQCVRTCIAVRDMYASQAEEIRQLKQQNADDTEAFEQANYTMDKFQQRQSALLKVAVEALLAITAIIECSSTPDTACINCHAREALAAIKELEDK